jgi:hypothetical protein
MAKQDRANVSARILLHGFLELQGLSPDLADWSEDRLAGNPPRLFRLRQLVALFRAFQIPWNPSLFVEGKFIEPESPRYATLLDMMDSTMPELKKHGFGAQPHQLPYCFEILFAYRGRVEHVLSFSSGVLEASGLYLYAHRRAGELNRIIKEHVSIIDDHLVAFISPEAREFSVKELVRDHGYPDVDLFEIDADWW